MIFSESSLCLSLFEGFMWMLQGVLGEITHHEVEDLLQQVVLHLEILPAFDDELAVGHQGQDLAQGQEVVDVLALVLVRCGLGVRKFLKSLICSLKMFTLGRSTLL